MSIVHNRDTCICCDSPNLELLLDLNSQPLANSYHDNSTALEEYPLSVNLCKNCYHIQLTHIVNPDLLFKNYLYVSGTTKTLRDYFEWFSNFVIDYVDIKVNNVLEIACNDGSQLERFLSKGISTYGVDPAENLYKLSSKNHNVVCDYFNSNTFKDKKFDVVIAQNVFAHNENARQFLNDCADIMHEESYLFIQTSQAEMIENNQFDTIYHEHISFFNTNSMNELAKRTSLDLIDSLKTPIHGTSYLFVFRKKIKEKKHERNKYLKKLIGVERSRGLLSDELYYNYKRNVMDIVSGFRRTIQTYRDRGFKIIGYGAAAKGMTFLNFSQCSLDSIVDDNDLKHGSYTPGTNILIQDSNSIGLYNEDDKLLFVPLAWNFYSEIKGRILNIRNSPQDRFLKYFPSITVEQ